MEQTQELNIRRYIQLVFKRRYLFAFTAAAIITTAVIISHMIAPIYEAKTVVSIEQSFLNSVLGNIGGPQTFDDKASALSTIMRSRTLVLRVMGNLGIDLQNMTQAQIEGLILSAQNRTVINIEFNRSNRKDVDFFTVSFQDTNPQLARDYVNNVVSLYIEESLGSKREDSFGAKSFLVGQIDQFREKVDKLDAEIAFLKKNRTVIMYDRLLDLQKRNEELLVQYTEDHPEVIKTQYEIELIKEKFKTSPQKLEGAARIRNQLTIFERERESKKKIYDELAAAYGKSEVSTQAEIQDKTGTFRIVDPAVLPIRPVSPNRIKIILMGMIGGIMGAVGLIVFLDFIDESVKSSDALGGFGIPVLAVIPHIPDPDELVKAKRKDIVLVVLSALFLVLLGAVMVRELFV